VLGTTLFARLSQGASFDCRKATTLIESAICSDSELSALDEALLESYKEVLQNASDDTVIKQEQEFWLKNVRDSCRTADCLKLAYRKRKLTLDIDTLEMLLGQNQISAPVAEVGSEDESILPQLGNSNVPVHSNAWQTRVGDEDWGETCYVSVRNSAGAEITILSPRDEFAPVLTIEPYQQSYGSNFPVIIATDNGIVSKLMARAPEYYDGSSLEIGIKELNALKKGAQLSLSIAKQETLTFDLSGSASAISQFLDCIKPKAVVSGEQE
jgi:uncharacterized protein